MLGFDAIIFNLGFVYLDLQIPNNWQKFPPNPPLSVLLQYLLFKMSGTSPSKTNCQVNSFTAFLSKSNYHDMPSL
jgi:hypothetical protein